MKKQGKLAMLVEKGIKAYDEHQREIMLGGAIAGTIVTAVLSWKAGIKADKIIDKYKVKLDKLESEDLSDEEYKEKKRDILFDAAKEVAPVAAPPAIAATGTIISVVGGYKVASKQIAALSTLYSMSKEALSTYQEKTKEMLGEKKAQEIVDNIAADKVAKNPPREDLVIKTGHGEVLCLDDYSGQLFYSDPEYIRKVVNDINEQLRDETFVSLDDFHGRLGLRKGKLGSDIGFCIEDGNLNVSFSYTGTTLGDRDNIPCLVLNYDVSPKYGFGDMGGRFGGWY